MSTDEGRELEMNTKTHTHARARAHTHTHTQTWHNVSDKIRRKHQREDSLTESIRDRLALKWGFRNLCISARISERHRRVAQNWATLSSLSHQTAQNRFRVLQLAQEAAFEVREVNTSSGSGADENMGENEHLALQQDHVPVSPLPQPSFIPEVYPGRVFA